MSILTPLVDRLAPDKSAAPPTPAKRPRPRFHVPQEPSPVLADKRGVSNEAVRLFDDAQRHEGTLVLQEVRWVNTRPADLRQLVAELEHFDLVTCEETTRGPRARTLMTVVPAYREVTLVSGGWDRWMGLR